MERTGGREYGEKGHRTHRVNQNSECSQQAKEISATPRSIKSVHEPPLIAASLGSKYSCCVCVAAGEARGFCSAYPVSLPRVESSQSPQRARPFTSMILGGVQRTRVTQ